LEALLQAGVGGSPDVKLTPLNDNIRSSLEVELTLSWSFVEASQLKVNLAAILDGLDLGKLNPRGLLLSLPLPNSQSVFMFYPILALDEDMKMFAKVKCFALQYAILDSHPNTNQFRLPRV
jgi:hypothetical protein